jgi:hypothetical protein
MPNLEEIEWQGRLIVSAVLLKNNLQNVAVVPLTSSPWPQFLLLLLRLETV